MAEDLKKKTGCIIGHRMLIPGDEPKILKRADYFLYPLITAGVIYYGIGGATGFDALMAEHLLDIRDHNCKRLRVIAVLPFRDWTARWPEDAKARVHAIVRRCNKVVYRAEEFYPGVYTDRDKYLIGQSSVCISYCNKAHGGTAASIRYAKTTGIKICNTSSFDLDYL